jgi:hypothetical protein
LRPRIPQTQDELRDRFVGKGLKTQLSEKCDSVVTDPFNLTLDRWKSVVVVRREEWKNKETKKRDALIYWTKDDSPEPLILTMTDAEARYQWDGTPATKDWASYDSAL